MDSSPSKRRRTSPSTSVAVTVENTDLRPSPQNGPSPSRRRLSFMSPTKASLARFHPGLLSRAKSAEPPRPVSKGLHDTIEQKSVAAGDANSIVGHVAGTNPKRLELGDNGVEKEQGPLATPRRRSQVPGDGNASTGQVQYSMNPDPRASPPEEARDEGTAANGTNGGHQEPVQDVADTGVTAVPDSQISQHPSTPTQHEHPVPTSGMGIGHDGEPTLPSTPSQLGLEPPREKPKGLLFSSPSKRPRRKGKSSAKSSPLKPSDNPPEHPNSKQRSSIPDLGPRRYIENTPKPPPPPEEAHLLELQVRLGDLEKQLQDIEDRVLRQLLVSSWQQEASKEDKTMAKQKREVSQQSTKVMQLRDEVLQIQATRSIDNVHTRPEEIDRNTKSSSLTQRLARFLPFSIEPPPTVPRPPSPKDTHTSQGLGWDLSQPAAASFTITTSNTLLLPPTVNNELLQRQDIIMSTSQRLLTSDLQLTANTVTQQISHLDIRAISSWAEPELGSWLRQSMEKMELTALGRAFGRYWEVAKLRGKCWISCKQDFENLVANAPESNSPLLYLGMQDLIFVRSNVQLKVSWRILISEQGEVESHSSAHPRFPATWQQEANSELAKIGDAFMMLVEDRGIPEAIGMICKVVFPT